MSTPEPLRVLIATVTMNARSGTDLYTRDLALALLRRGCLPIVYTGKLGGPAEELRQATIPVVDDLEAIAATPDVIHGHHVLETLAATARFPGVPALFVCHDGLGWHSIPPRTRRIRTWVAVDRNCRDRMMFEHGVKEESIRVLANAVDLARFRPRDPLPARPRRALIFNNDAVESGQVLPIRAACEANGIVVEVAGLLSGRLALNPEQLLPAYDLVFARARCALEAAAVGNSVIVCDSRGMAGMLTSESLEAMRALNFGARTLRLPVTEENVRRELARYDAADAARVSLAIRSSASIDVLADQFLSLYEELAATSAGKLTPEEELREVARALSSVTRTLRIGPPVPRRRLALLNSRLLARPVRALRWLRARLDL